MKFPEMRKELIGYLYGLSDLDYQLNCWVNGVCPEEVEHDELDYAIHFLFDDTDLSTEPRKLIGHILKNEDEAKLIQNLCEKIQGVFDKHGTEKSDEEYVRCLEWKSVLDAAHCAYIELRKN